MNSAPQSISDLPAQDRIDHDIWLRDFVCPLTYTEAELDELARLDASTANRRVYGNTPHEL